MIKQTKPSKGFRERMKLLDKIHNLQREVHILKIKDMLRDYEDWMGREE